MTDDYETKFVQIACGVNQEWVMADADDEQLRQVGFIVALDDRGQVWMQRLDAEGMETPWVKTSPHRLGRLEPDE